MIRLPHLSLIAASIFWASHAAEITIEQRPFATDVSFAATVIPDKGCVLLALEPEAWEDFQIVDLASHGSRVAKGDVLIDFDAEAIGRKIEDVRQAVGSTTLLLAQAERDFKHLQETAPHTLEALRRAAETAKEENSYFTKTRRKAAEETAALTLERKKQMLSNQQEELTQLAKMYAADDLTEDTEEIILTRQKDEVVAAEFAVKMETLDFKRTVEVILPREAISLANNERDTSLQLSKAEADIPRSIEIKKTDLDALKMKLLREKDNLAKLEKDRTRFEIKAPADGWFYHGPIENGRWSPADALKTLFKGGRPPAKRPIATFVPAIAKVALVAFVEDSVARPLKPEFAGSASMGGREDIEIDVKVVKVASVPEADGTYRVDLSATWPKDFTPATGTVAQIRMVTYSRSAAIAIPTKAMAYDEKGWTVELKLADGKTERRLVKRGRLSKETTEIQSGLEVGQVIMAP